MLQVNRWINVVIILLWSTALCAAQTNTLQANAEEKTAKMVLDYLVHADYAKVTMLFDADFKKTLSADEIKKGWEKEIKTVGAFEKLQTVHTRKLHDGRIMVALTGKFAKGGLDVQVYFSNHQVSGLFLTEPPVYRKGSPNETAARLVVTQMAGGQFDKVVATFDKTMTEKLPVSDLSSTWQQLKQQAGNFQSISSTVVQVREGLEIVTVTCKFQRGMMNIRIVYDKAGKIAGLFFVPH